MIAKVSWSVGLKEPVCSPVGKYGAWVKALGMYVSPMPAATRRSASP